MSAIAMTSRTNFFERKNAEYRLATFSHDSIAEEEL